MKAFRSGELDKVVDEMEAAQAPAVAPAAALEPEPKPTPVVKLSTSSLPPSAEAKAIPTATHLLVTSRFANLRGGYVRQGELRGWPVYKREVPDGATGSEASPAYLYFHKATWTMSKTPPDKPAHVFGRADGADLFSAAWPADLLDAVEEVKDVERPSKAAGATFEDAAFPPAPASLGPGAPPGVAWVRLADLSDAPPLVVDAAHLMEGSAGESCWLIGALASLGEFPGYLASLLKGGADGKQVVKLFDIREGAWVDVTVDDLIPCAPRRWWQRSATPCFAKPRGNAPWVLLVEKAMAKLAGSYAAIKSGQTVFAWQMLTGCTDALFLLRLGGETAWTQYKLKVGLQREAAKSGGFLPADLPWRRVASDPVFEAAALFAQLSKLSRGRYPVAARVGVGSGTAAEEAAEAVALRRRGLVAHHSYALLQAAKVGDDCFVQMQNHWGTACEWSGAWADESGDWERRPDVEAALKPTRKSGDGKFWMSFADFVKIFTHIYVCPLALGENALQ